MILIAVLCQEFSSFYQYWLSGPFKEKIKGQWLCPSEGKKSWKSKNSSKINAGFPHFSQGNVIQKYVDLQISNLGQWKFGYCVISFIIWCFLLFTSKNEGRLYFARDAFLWRNFSMKKLHFENLFCWFDSSREHFCLWLECENDFFCIFAKLSWIRIPSYDKE